ncbi:MAG: lytic transglycosylase domain-containing protein, partial [Deltaproteobacteria bacterium]|nr:lytic transglycosylase domain-containing protein [Deltaproteobacteria bacterium]
EAKNSEAKNSEAKNSEAKNSEAKNSEAKNSEAKERGPADEENTAQVLELLAPVRPCDARRRIEDFETLGTKDEIERLLKELPLEPSAGVDQGCVAFLRGQGAFYQGRFEESMVHFSLAKKKLPALKDGIAVWHFRAQVEQDPDAALKVLKNLKRRLRRHASLKEEVELLEAKAVRKIGKAEDILRVQGALLRNRIGDPAASLHHLAKAFSALDNKRAAGATLRSLLVEYPGHPLAKDEEHHLGDDVLLSPKEQATRIENLIKVSRMQRALDEAQAYPRVGLSHSADRVPLEVATVKSMVRADDPEGAVRHAARLLARHKPHFEWRRVHAWALGKARKYDEAREAWKEVLAAAKTPKEKADACFFQGFTAYETDKDEVAEHLWSSCEADLAGSDFAPLALWYRGLLHYSAAENVAALTEGEERSEIGKKRLLAALTLWRRLQRKYAAHKESTKHQYWLARALFENNDEKAAQKIWAQLLARHPTTYYGLLAARRLGLPAIEGTEILPTALADSAKETRSVKNIELAHSLHLDALAKDLIGRLKKNDRFGVMHRIGLFHEVWRYGAKGIPRPPVRGRKLVDVAGWRMSYAMPFSAKVEAAAARHEVDASFVYAIMRTESGFRADVKSHAGALGLLQLMPYTAIGMAKKLKQKPPLVEDLINPDVNIELGAAFLGASSREFGSILLAAACYNGAPQNVSEWQFRSQHLHAELFVERIPFKETRNYVKKVLSTEALYRSLEGDPLDLDLPEGVIGPPPTRYTSFSSTDDGG